MKTIIQLNQYVFLISSLLTLFIYLIITQPVFILISIFLIWCNNIFYALYKFRRRVIFFFFHITIFIFLLVRPYIDLFRGNEWFLMPIKNYYKEANTLTGLFILLLTLYALWIGGILGNQYLLRKGKSVAENKKIPDTNVTWALRTISIIIYSLALIAIFALGAEKIAFISNHSYVDFYVLYESNLPYWVYAFSTFLEFSLYVYLATLPRKRNAFIVLLLYVMASVPDLIVGTRTQFVQSVLLSLIYYILRDFYSNKNIWMGRFERTCLIICLPIGIAFLGLYNYIREGTAISGFSFVDIILDFFHKQGVTFSWFCSGLGALKYLPNADSPNYTLGRVIDYFQYGKLGQLITGNPGLGSGNSVIRATQGNSMSHHISYILLGNRYLNGHGCGSSFLLDVFADNGYLGVFFFCLILGFLLVYMVELAKHNTMCFIIVLASIEGILIMPRSEAISGIQFLFRIPFWMVMFVSFTGALLIKRKYTLYSNRNDSQIYIQ